VGKPITDFSSVTTVGLDLAKHVFQVHCVDASGRVVLNKSVRHNRLLELFASLPRSVVGLEACGSAHHWARELINLGHDARMMPPAYVKPLYSPAEDRRRGCSGDLRSGDAAFDAFCCCALA
jgi:transposase